MTVIEAINEIDQLKPNQYGIPEKVRWLSRLDRRIFEQIILTHGYNEGEDPVEFSGYTEDDTDAELLVGEPYDEIYVHWLAAQIDYNNLEFDGFNATNALFESVFSAFQRAYNRSHMPRGARKRYF